MNWFAIALGIGSYLLGSIPFGVLVARSRGVDIMSCGSGSTGATNIYRTLGMGPGIAVFLLDVAKGLIPAILALSLTSNSFIAFGVGIAAVIGHSLSPWLGFRGGKGIATGLGMMLGCMPFVALSALGVFIVVVALSGRISVGSIVAGISLAPFGIAFHYAWQVNLTLGLLGAFILLRHQGNIRRLLKGEEPRFSFQSKGNANQAPPDREQEATKPASELDSDSETNKEPS